MIGFCPGAEFGPANAGRTITMQSWRNSLSVIRLSDLSCLARRKDHEEGNEILATLSTEQQAWCRNLAGETQLEQAVILIAACRPVTNDSG